MCIVRCRSRSGLNNLQRSNLPNKRLFGHILDTSYLTSRLQQLPAEMRFIDNQHRIIGEQSRLHGTHGTADSIATKQQPTTEHIRRCTDYSASLRIIAPFTIRTDATTKFDRNHSRTRRFWLEPIINGRTQIQTFTIYIELVAFVVFSLYPLLQRACLVELVIDQRAAVHRQRQTTRNALQRHASKLLALGAPLGRDKPGHCIEEHMDIDYTSLARCRRRSNTLWPMPMSSDIQHQSNLPLIGLTDRLIITRWMNHSNEFFKSCCEVLPLFQIHFSHVGTPFPKSSSGRSELR